MIGRYALTKAMGFGEWKKLPEPFWHIDPDTKTIFHDGYLKLEQASAISAVELYKFIQEEWDKQ